MHFWFRILEKDGGGEDVELWFKGIEKDGFLSFESSHKEVGWINDFQYDSIEYSNSSVSEGEYEIWAYATTGKRDEPIRSKDPWTITVINSATANYDMIIWAGQNQIGSVNDTLGLPSHNRGIPIRVQCLQNGNGLNDETVDFSTNFGILTNYSDVTGTRFGVSGIGETYLILNSGELDNYEVTASWTDPNGFYRSVIIGGIRAIGDDEDFSGGDPNNWSHRRNQYYSTPYGKEIPGDGFDDDTEDWDPTLKDVWIEIDYDPNVISKMDASEVADSVKAILERARDLNNVLTNSGLYIVEAFPDDAITTPSYADRKQRRKLLKNSRTYQDMIHVILGKTIDTGDRGITEEYFFELFEQLQDFNKTMMYLDHYVSGLTPEESQNYLDSTGCYVAVEKIINEFTTPGPGVVIKAIALVTAHEVGHALGMTHTYYYDENGNRIEEFDDNLMVENFGPFDDPGAFYQKYNFFRLESLQCSDTKTPYNKDYIFSGLFHKRVLGRNVLYPGIPIEALFTIFKF